MKDTKCLNFDPQPFFDCIKTRRSNVTDPAVLRGLDDAEFYLIIFALEFPPGVPLASVPTKALELLDRMIGSLRCLGVAPEGWPAPPAEGAQLECKTVIIVPRYEAN